MKRLQYDQQRQIYVDDVRMRSIELGRVDFLGERRRIDKSCFHPSRDFHEALEEQVKKLLREMFPQKNLQPSAYVLTDLDYFYILDFLSAPESLYVSLFGSNAEAAK